MSEDTPQKIQLKQWMDEDADLAEQVKQLTKDKATLEATLLRDLTRANVILDILKQTKEDRLALVEELERTVTFLCHDFSVFEQREAGEQARALLTRMEG